MDLFSDASSDPFSSELLSSEPDSALLSSESSPQATNSEINKVNKSNSKPFFNVISLSVCECTLIVKMNNEKVLTISIQLFEHLGHLLCKSNSTI